MIKPADNANNALIPISVTHARERASVRHVIIIIISHITMYYVHASAQLAHTIVYLVFVTHQLCYPGYNQSAYHAHRIVYTVLIQHHARPVKCQHTWP